jgi:hypothetical protein
MSNQNNNQLGTEELLFDVGTLVSKSKLPFERVKGPSFFRILPPFGANSGRSLFHFYAVHWGFTNSNGKESPVACSYYTAEKFCPVCTLVMDTEQERNRALENKDKETADKLEPVIQKFRVQKFYVYNAFSAEKNQVVVLQLKPTAHSALLELINKAVNEKKFDPTHPLTGAWFKFDFDKTKPSMLMYSVAFKEASRIIDGQEFYTTDRSPLEKALSEEILTQVKTGNSGPLFDIHALYEPKTAADLQSYLSGAAVEYKNNNNDSRTKASATTAQNTTNTAPVAETAAYVPNNNTQAATTTTGVNSLVNRGNVDAQTEIERLRKMQQKANANGA